MFGRPQAIWFRYRHRRGRGSSQPVGGGGRHSTARFSALSTETWSKGSTPGWRGEGRPAGLTLSGYGIASNGIVIIQNQVGEEGGLERPVSSTVSSPTVPN